MTEHSPNEQQERLIEITEGIYKVDAGAGTGKTFTITRRYAYILENRDVEPDDILLTTFTENAAENMKENIINHCSYDKSALREAPISTFHAYCSKLLDNHGFKAPELLGMDESYTSSTRILENKVLEKQKFSRFINDFIERYPEYNEFYRITNDYSDLLNLIKSLCCKGIFPEKDGWYRDSEKHLEGDFEEFLEVFREKNRPRNDGSKQSELRSRLGRYGDKLTAEDAPTRAEIRGERGTKKIPEKYAEEAFKEEREGLKTFIHDLYFEYVEYALSRNYMNFSFLMMLAYVLLVEKDDLREEQGFEYVMLDEFQDTNEIQFKLSLLLSNTGNIAVVGDWKQSIFSFQYASVKNIRKFRERLRKYKSDLNSGRERITYGLDVEGLALSLNYRSSSKILEFSEQSLSLRGKDKEKLEEPDVVSLEAAEDKNERTEISAFISEEEIKAVLERIQEIVDNPEYTIYEDGKERQLRYGDVAVLTRMKNFGLDLQKKAREYGIPAAYEGGVKLFETDPAILLLAWLRMMNWKESRRGWAVVLEYAGYNLPEIKEMLDKERYPWEMEDFLEELDEEDDIGAVARKVFNRYGMDNGFTAKIIEELQSVFNTSYMNEGQIARFIEENIEEGEEYDVDNSLEEDVVTIQTIHKAKGLEYPAVFISDINDSHFPSRNPRSSSIIYREPIGLRQKKRFIEGDRSYTYWNWRTEILAKSLSGGYDEERRLMYVAMTRAENYLFLTSEEGRESQFYEDLDIEKECVEPEIEKEEADRERLPELEAREPEESAPLKLSAHAVTGEGEDVEAGRGIEFGKEVHRFAEYIVKGKEVKTGEEEDYRNVRSYIESLKGKLKAEESVLLPLEVEGRKVVLSGVIDLINETDDCVEMIDYKTDLTREREESYRRQLSVYYHVLDALYEKEVVTKLFYTKKGDEVEVEPLSRERLEEIVSV